MSKHKQAQTLMNRGAFAQAIPLLERACKAQPGDANNWRLLGICHSQCNDYPKAEFCFRKSLSCNPGLSQTHVALGSLLAKRQAWPQAVEHFQQALKLKPDQALVCNDLGYCLQRMRQPEQALDAYKKSLQINPEQSLTNRNLGLLYEQLHRLEEARRHAGLAIDQSPGDIEAHILLAKLDAREDKAAAATERLRALLERDLKPFHRAAVNIELGKILDRQGKSLAAFDHLRRGKDGFSKLYKVTRSGNRAYRNAIDRFHTVFTGDATRGWSSQLPDDPLRLIFLVGFPRSGTTLTEQILESHPQVTATHELPVLVDMSTMIGRILDRQFDYPDKVPYLSGDEVKRLRQFYLQSMQQALQNNIDSSRFLLDKLPLNMVHLGLIARLFPEARILVALRDPRDVCLSCYLQTFEMNPAMSQFLDIKDTAEFYASVMGLWLHYKQTLELDFLETRYEALVENPEKAARGMLDFIGLPWNASVLNFHRQARERRVYTPSYAAVTQPIYTRAAGKWRAYKDQLQPVIETLQPFIDTFGYNQ